jgi:hypothetical protein
MDFGIVMKTGVFEARAFIDERGARREKIS